MIVSVVTRYCLTITITCRAARWADGFVTKSQSGLAESRQDRIQMITVDDNSEPKGEL
jgi:hypothetical protein